MNLFILSILKEKLKDNRIFFSTAFESKAYRYVFVAGLFAIAFGMVGNPVMVAIGGFCCFPGLFLLTAGVIASIIDVALFVPAQLVYSVFELASRACASVITLCRGSKHKQDNHPQGAAFQKTDQDAEPSCAPTPAADVLSVKEGTGVNDGMEKRLLAGEKETESMNKNGQ